MGHLVEKYTAAYFLKKDENGSVLPYGVEGIEAFEQGELREHDRAILEHVDFRGASVLEFGFGRGESIKYAWERGAAAYVGVDFSESACRIAGGFLQKFKVEGPRIVCSDALEFLRQHVAQGEAAQKFDVVMMLDFVEHVPRSELAEVLRLLGDCLKETSVVAVNTPDFLFDNDVISEGLNEQGCDSSDFIDETRGMHCNRYTLDSLRRFFLALGYAAVGRGHYFVPATPEDQNPFGGVRSYAGDWQAAQARGCKLMGNFPRESFEVTYEVQEKPELHTFLDGNLAGLSIYVTRSYLEYYGGGNYDDFLSGFIARHDLAGKTVFDLGGFVGVNSMQFARLVGPNGRVCAFEPNPINADRLRQNLSENGELESRVRVYPFALSNEQGTVRFNVHRNVDAGVSSASYMQGAHTTLSEGTLAGLGFTEVDVRSCTLDEFVRRTGFVPGLVKMDIEGSEHLALLGAMATMKDASPAVMVELHSIYCAVMVLNALEGLGYVCELLHVEEDGRCYIGAAPRAKAAEARRSEQDVEVLQATVYRHELERVRLRIEAQARQQEQREGQHAQERARLQAEIAGLRVQQDSNSSERNVERSQTESERQAERAAWQAALEDRTAQCNAQIAQLETRLREQEVAAGALAADLERIRSSPLIRVGRKVRRVFLLGTR
ncbi:FkbM family methyltransferase [Ramlibacter sp. G-1-2-2]|uniref:FkbM family methyltransferase n=1 Tax=Ramlibacter agri TaxID=2728837 RepID=A0A848HE57_9BURK|nr:FkbM family methyltransferase [Ramlibacter agri]NML47769.1 FkbM family methyltransferase [Ramlibacter agri]